MDRATEGSSGDAALPVVSADAESRDGDSGVGATTGAVRLAAARGAREGHRAPITGELTASDLRWFGRKATVPAGTPATAYV
jgi:hypothetical protein